MAKSNYMNKILTFILFLSFAVGAKAQYGSINAILDRLEQKKGINKQLKNINLNQKKFVLSKEYDDHTERNFLVLDGNKATYIELFDDKADGKTSSNVFTGDFVRSDSNIISVRCDLLEGKKVALPLTKTFLLTQQKDILYLVDIASKDRWIDETAIAKK